MAQKNYAASIEHACILNITYTSQASISRRKHRFTGCSLNDWISLVKSSRNINDTDTMQTSVRVLLKTEPENNFRVADNLRLNVQKLSVQFWMNEL